MIAARKGNPCCKLPPRLASMPQSAKVHGDDSTLTSCLRALLGPRHLLPAFLRLAPTHPISMSLAVVVFAACIAITAASATRVPMSYWGMFLTLPASLFFVTLANIAMSRQLRRSVAILDFPGAEELAGRLDWPVPIVGLDEIGVGIRRVLIDPKTHHSSEWTQTMTKLYLRGLEIESWPSFLEACIIGPSA